MRGPRSAIIDNVAGGRDVRVRRRLARTRFRLRRATSRENRRFDGIRFGLASRYLTGSGLEIGALHMPLRVPGSATVRYVDRAAPAALREQYPELADHDLVDVDIVDDGEVLGTIADASQDFVIANHFLEHTENPIATIESHLRVLRPGGILYMAIPDKRATFDRARPETSLEHLLRDYREGPEWSRSGHFEEWASEVSTVLNGLDRADVAAEARRLEEQRYSIHFHVWTPESLLALLLHCRRELGLPFELEALQRNGHEVIVVLRRESS